MSIPNDKELKLPIELEIEFKGKGQMSNFYFKQIKKTDFGYIYELKSESYDDFNGNNWIDVNDLKKQFAI